MPNNQSAILQLSKKAIKRVNIGKNRFADKWDILNWITSHIHIKKGRKHGLYSFDDYEPYMEIASAMHQYPENWFLKGTQIGFSTLMIGWNLYLPYWKGLDSGYALPDKVMIKPFMKTRFSEEQINQNNELEEIYQVHESDMYYSSGRNYLYFLGANVLSEGMSRPMEQISLDEVTIISQDSIELMEDRLGAASFGQINGFAMEIYPQGPADDGFLRGRQNVMIYKCPHCGQDDQNLEEIFYQSTMDKQLTPACMKKIDGKWQVVCVKCGKPYSRKENGRWVARYPDRDVNSWRVPQLIIPAMNLDRIMRRWLKTSNKKAKRAHVHSTVCAIPDAGDLQGIQKDDFIQLKADYPMRPVAKWSVGGGDMGNTCYIVFLGYVDGLVRYLWWVPVDSDRFVETTAKYIRALNCRKFVVDYKPLTPEVRKLQRMFPGIVVAHEYREGGLEEKQKEHEGREYDFVEEEREEALDMYDDFLTALPPKVQMPAQAVDDSGGLVDLEDSSFAKMHYKGSQKDEIEDKRLGKKVFKHKKNVENHYYHAGSYAFTAFRLLMKDAAEFTGMVPIFDRLF